MIKNARLLPRTLLVLLTLVFLCGEITLATAPSWWTGVFDPNAQADDFAVINQGQLKHLASKAAEELNANLPGQAGAAINNLVSSWTPANPNTDDFAAVNIGQLKFVAGFFYDRFIAEGYAQGYPWGKGQPDDFALANIGQAKHLFSFNLTLIHGTHVDLDGNGLPDDWEIAWFGATGQNPNALNPDGISYLICSLQGRNPATGSVSDGAGALNMRVLAP